MVDINVLKESYAMFTLLPVKRDDCMLSIRYRPLSLSRKPCGIVCLGSLIKEGVKSRGVLDTEMLDCNLQHKIE